MNKSMTAFLFLSVMGLTGCESFHGTMNVYSPLQLNNQHIRHLSETYFPGTYDLKVHIHGVQRFLEVKVPGYSTIKLNFPKNAVSADGSVYFSGAAAGQDWNAIGTLNSNSVQSAPWSGSQMCTISSWTDYNGNVYVNYGQQSTLQHSVTTTDTLNLQFVSPYSNAVLADLSGSNTRSYTVTDRVGPCM